jgi:transcriptional regulator with XRE-family HTH domain
MNCEQMINMATAYKGMSQAALARAIGMTPSGFNQRVKRGAFTREELDAMAQALGAVYHSYFEFPDGTRIGAPAAVGKEI